MKRPPRLVALSPGDLQDARACAAFLRRVRELVEGGLRGLVLREPELEDGPTLVLARELRAMLPADQAWLAVHDRVHVAVVAGADAVHLGFRSLTVADARAALSRARPAGSGQALAVGLSTHASDDPATWAGADHVFHGPFDVVRSKADALPPVGAEGIARACAARPDERAPLLALGGIDGTNAARALAAGADGVVVRGALMGAADPRPVLAELLVATAPPAP